MRKVPLGLAYLAASLKEKGVYVQAYNLNVDPIDGIDVTSFDFVGITCLTPFISEINNICEYLKRKNSGIKIVVGGPHPTYQIRETFRQMPHISYAITGEGEAALPELVLNEADYQEIRGVYYKDGDGAVAGTPHEIVDLKALPYPDRKIFDHGRLEKRNPFRSILASRGCPYPCRNCQPMLKMIQPFRMREPEDVFEEILHLQKSHGQKYFGFLDSEFPIKKSFLMRLKQLIDEHGLVFSFHCNARSDLLDEDILHAYKQLNITRLAIGIESGVQRVVNEVLLKKIDLDYTRKMFESANKIGIQTHGHFMIGIPGETLSDMKQTLDYAMSLPAASIEFNMLTPWPGTAFFELCMEKGYLVNTDPSQFNEKRESHVSTEDFTREEVNQFYGLIRDKLTGLGWKNSADGSVYFHPKHSELG